MAEQTAATPVAEAPRKRGQLSSPETTAGRKASTKGTKRKRTGMAVCSGMEVDVTGSDFNR